MSLSIHQISLNHIGSYFHLSFETYLAERNLLLILKRENILVRALSLLPASPHLLKARHNILLLKPQASGRQERNPVLKETQEIDIKTPQHQK